MLMHPKKQISEVVVRIPVMLIAHLQLFQGMESWLLH
jgi:hypothetical protein